MYNNKILTNFMQIKIFYFDIILDKWDSQPLELNDRTFQHK